MSRHRRFHIKSLEEMQNELKAYAFPLAVTEDVAILKTPLQIGRHEVPNRLTVHPMEGFDADPDGKPGEFTQTVYLGADSNYGD